MVATWVGGAPMVAFGEHSNRNDASRWNRPGLRWKAEWAWAGISWKRFGSLCVACFVDGGHQARNSSLNRSSVSKQRGTTRFGGVQTCAVTQFLMSDFFKIFG